MDKVVLASVALHGSHKCENVWVEGEYRKLEDGDNAKALIISLDHSLV